MKVYMLVISTLMKLAASAVDEELQLKYMTMTRSNFLEHFNERNYSWKIKQYTNISLNILVNYNIHDLRTEALPVKYIDPKKVYQLPKIFDARKKWPQCLTIKKNYNQYGCYSCWAHGVANTASDRICIHSGMLVDLSEQDLECSHPHQTICHSGSPSIGFQFWKDYGLVPRACKPYDPFDVNRNECTRFCKYNPILKVYLNSKFYAKEVYTVPHNDSLQIKAELFLNGPIQALMAVYEDFNNEHGHGYSSGIYEHTYGKLLGFHSVRVIGYGVENGVEYWLAANSWGPEWGEEGLFRIKSFQPSIRFEEAMSTGIPLSKPISN